MYVDFWHCATLHQRLYMQTPHAVSVLTHVWQLSHADCTGTAGAGQSAVSAVRAARKACLNTTFSMLERDSFGPEQGHLSNLQKVC